MVAHSVRHKGMKFSQKNGKTGTEGNKRAVWRSKNRGVDPCSVLSFELHLVGFCTKRDFFPFELGTVNETLSFCFLIAVLSLNSQILASGNLTVCPLLSDLVLFVRNESRGFGF